MTTFDARARFHSGHLEVLASDTVSPGAVVTALDPHDTRSVEAARAARIDCTATRLTVDVPGKGKWRGGVQVRIQLTVPTRAKVTSESADVTLSTSGELDDLIIRTGSGDVHALEVNDLVDVKAGDANVTVGSPRRVSFTTGNGQLIADGVGDLTFKTGHGKATLGSTSGTVVIKGGNVGLELAAASSGDILFQTGAGGARIGVVEGTDVQLDLQSGLGDVRCELPVEQGPPAGGAGLKVRLVTGMGDLVVARAG